LFFVMPFRIANSFEFKEVMSGLVYDGPLLLWWRNDFLPAGILQKEN